MNDEVALKQHRLFQPGCGLVSSWSFEAHRDSTFVTQAGSAIRPYVFRHSVSAPKNVLLEQFGTDLEVEADSGVIGTRSKQGLLIETHFRDAGRAERRVCGRHVLAVIVRPQLSLQPSSAS